MRISSILKSFFNHFERSYKRFRPGGKGKIFCIGANKTGTTSLQKTFEELGYVVGNQRRAELLLSEYKCKNFKPIIDYCKTAQVFQDFPFSYPETYKCMDKAFPGSKFILSIRNSPEEWYSSLVNFHSIIFGNGKTPTAEDLRNADYIRKGWVWEARTCIYSTSENDPYNKDILIQYYVSRNNDIIKYFENRPQDLLILNLAEKNAFEKFRSFLGLHTKMKNFPWENKTIELSLDQTCILNVPQTK